VDKAEAIAALEEAANVVVATDGREGASREERKAANDAYAAAQAEVNRIEADERRAAGPVGPDQALGMGA